MGLLDQVLGQVIGGMAGGMGGGPSGPARPMPGGLPGQAGGGLGDLLGGAAGKYSPLVMALLSLLASKHLGTGAGGYGSILNDVFGKITGGGAAPAGTEAGSGRYGGPGDDGSGGGRPYGGDDALGEEEPRFPTGGRGRQAGGGGFLDSVGSLLDGPGGSRHVSGQEGGSGSPVGRGLEGLSDHFRQNGHGETIESWIGGGQNQSIAPRELDRALGPDTVEQLSRQTGLGRDELLSQLSHALPQVVDGLTPHGRLPTPDEHRGWV